MEKNNTEGFLSPHWFDWAVSRNSLLPSAVFLVTLLLFQLLSLLLILQIALAVKSFKVEIALAVKSLNSKSSPGEPDGASQQPGEASNNEAQSLNTERQPTNQPRTRFRGTGNKETNTNSTQFPTGPDILTPSAPPLMTSTQANPSTPQYPVYSCGISPLNPIYEDTTQQQGPFADQKPPSPYPCTRTDTSYRPETSSSSRRKERIPEVFTGDDTELKEWLCTFDILSKLNGWSESDKGSNLASLLRGNALQVLDDLPTEERGDYNTIVDALKRRFEPEWRKGQKKQEFKDRIKRRNESMAEFGYSLRSLVKSAYPTMPFENREELAIEQLIEGLYNKEIKKHVLYGKPKSINQAIALAEEYECVETRFEGRKPEDGQVRAISQEEEGNEGDLRQLIKDISEGQKQLVTPVMNQGPGYYQAVHSLYPTEVNMAGYSLCPRCGDEHGPQGCRAEFMRCHTCRKFGHLSKTCTKRRYRS